MSDDNDAECTVCGTPSTKRCTACKTTKYCSIDCQTKDWSDHMSACKDIQLENKIARAVNITHEAYLTFRENTYETPVSKVEEREDALVIHDPDIMSSHYFVKFPNHLAPDRRAKLAMLCSFTCHEPIAFMLNLLAKLLKGVHLSMEELTVDFKCVPRKCIYLKPKRAPDANFPKYLHEIIRLTSRKSGKQWAVDFSGGQYGICDPLHKWTQYEENYVRKVVGIYPPGSNKWVVNALGQLPGNPALIYGLVNEVSKAFDVAVGIWQDQHTELSNLTALPDVDFEPRKAELLDALDKAVQKFVNSPTFACTIPDKINAASLWEMANPGVSVENSKKVNGVLETYNLLKKH